MRRIGMGSMLMQHQLHMERINMLQLQAQASFYNQTTMQQEYYHQNVALAQEIPSMPQYYHQDLVQGVDTPSIPQYYHQDLVQGVDTPSIPQFYHQDLVQGVDTPSVSIKRRSTITPPSPPFNTSLGNSGLANRKRELARRTKLESSQLRPLSRAPKPVSCFEDAPLHSRSTIRNNSSNTSKYDGLVEEDDLNGK